MLAECKTSGLKSTHSVFFRYRLSDGETKVQHKLVELAEQWTSTHSLGVNPYSIILMFIFVQYSVFRSVNPQCC